MPLFVLPSSDNTSGSGTPFVLPPQNKTCLWNLSVLMTQTGAGCAVPPGKSQVRAGVCEAQSLQGKTCVIQAMPYLLRAVLCIIIWFNTAKNFSLFTASLESLWLETGEITKSNH